MLLAGACPAWNIFTLLHRQSTLAAGGQSDSLSAPQAAQHSSLGTMQHEWEEEKGEEET